MQTNVFTARIRFACMCLRAFARAVGAALAVCLLFMGGAHAAESSREGFFYCNVLDIGTVPPKTWASSVFTSTYGSGDAGGALRSNEIAAAFLLHVNSLGGTGQKNCLMHPVRAELEALRAQQRASASERYMFMKVGDWHDVDWTPAPWAPTATMALGTPVTRWFYCSSTQFYSPGCSGRSCSVASTVFAMPSPAGDYVKWNAQAQAYADSFRPQVRAQGVSDENLSCQHFDTRVEADKSFRDNRNSNNGFNQKYIELAWQPAEQAAIPAAQRSRVTQPASTTAIAAPKVAASSAASTPATRASTAQPKVAAIAPSLLPAPTVKKFCHAYIQPVGERGGIRTKVWENIESDGSTEAMTASLTAFVAQVRRLQPDKWHEFPPANCSDTYCYMSAVRYFFGTSQIAGQFCEATREASEQGWQRLSESDDSLEIIDWSPTSPPSLPSP